MSQVVEEKVVVPNPQGIHARPSAMIVKTAAGFDATLHIENPAEDVCADASSIMEVMTLVATQGTELHITGEGPEAAEGVRALTALIRRGFDEMDT
ncbi:MAG TPA: HPr family phosphocarrier protein [Planctomycetes bacterium]|nr:HPr family phosphocarrier protein [Planctomycetota bacterium]